MQTLHIEQLSKHYRVGDQQRELLPAIDRVLLEVLEDYLPAALGVLGMGEQEELCIRHVQVPLCFYAAKTATTNGQDWCQLLVKSIESGLASSDNVLRFASRRSALQDFALQLARQNLRHAWAWNQLQLCRLADGASLGQARQQLLCAWLREPELILPGLYQLHQQQLLVPLLLGFNREQVDELWRGWMDYCGVERLWLQASPEHLPVPPLSATVAGAVPVPGAGIWGELRQQIRAVAAGPVSACHWALLISMQQAPASFLATEAQLAGQLLVLEQQLRGELQWSPLALNRAEKIAAAAAGSSASDAQTRSPVTTVAADAGIAAAHLSAQELCDQGLLEQERRARELAETVLPEKVSLDSASPVAPAQEQFTDSTAASEIEPIVAPGQALDPTANRSDNKFQADALGGNSVANKAQSQSLLAAPVAPLHSDFAGLFLLLPVLQRCNLISALLEDATLEQRPLSWTLYQLCQRWLTIADGFIIADGSIIADTDPALKLFCSVSAADDWPFSQQQKIVSPAEGVRLQDYAGQVLHALADCLPWPQTAQAIMARVCQRPGRLLNEGGWLEVSFSLRQVDTDIRRAALDLDPDFVPWLGKVVKIRYE